VTPLSPMKTSSEAPGTAPELQSDAFVQFPFPLWVQRICAMAASVQIIRSIRSLVDEIS
jgi:hypothetical protein